ncbi:MAG: helix-turn-helix transcriptional regulator [Clostridia bacterium]|nr:helix-turn-helix transcriptional regulator [Clostridia bacterium]
MSLGENIYRHRISKGWSQTDLAEALDVSRQSVSKWENDSAVPDLDRLVRMRSLFDVTLDELVFGTNDRQKPPAVFQKHTPAPRILFGIAMLVFGMVFFLLSIFWGDHLAFGEAFGELMSAAIVLVSIAMIAPYDFRVLAVSAVIFFLYTVVCFGLLKITNVFSSLFTILASTVIAVWFLVCGLHATKDEPEASPVSIDEI